MQRPRYSTKKPMLTGASTVVATNSAASIGIAASLWPMIVPGHYTPRQASSSESTQAFLLVGTFVLLPVILFYTGWS